MSIRHCRHGSTAFGHATPKAKAPREASAIEADFWGALWRWFQDLLRSNSPSSTRIRLRRERGEEDAPVSSLGPRALPPGLLF
jgi:hypothetical protein